MKGRTIDSKSRKEIIKDWIERKADVSSQEYEDKYNISKEAVCLILDDALKVMKKNYRKKTGGIHLALREIKKEYKKNELNPMQLREKAMKRFVDIKQNSSSSISLEQWSKIINMPIHQLRQAIKEYGKGV
jgi:predicted HTH domain antitoxin